MKRLGIIAAAIVGFFSAPTAANAYVQPPVAAPANVPTITLVTHADVIQRWDDRRYDRRGRYYDRRDWRRDRRWRNNRGRWRTRCFNQWRNGYRERVCRRVRYR